MRLANPKPGICSACFAGAPVRRLRGRLRRRPVLDRETGTIAVLPWSHAAVGVRGEAVIVSGAPVGKARSDVRIDYGTTRFRRVLGQPLRLDRRRVGITPVARSVIAVNVTAVTAVKTGPGRSLIPSAAPPLSTPPAPSSRAFVPSLSASAGSASESMPIVTMTLAIAPPW